MKESTSWKIYQVWGNRESINSWKNLQVGKYLVDKQVRKYLVDKQVRSIYKLKSQ